jgi:tetratricopeptide (TPR) repeat protein
VATVATVATAEPAAGSAPAPTGPSAGGPAQADAGPADAGPADPAQAVVPGQGVTVAPTGGVAADARVDAGTPSATPAAVARDVPVRPPRDEPASLLRTTLSRAREQRDRGRCESALVLYGKALSLDGRNAVALAGRGACYLELTRYVQAEASFEAALESDPRNAEAIYGMAETYRYMGRKAEAVAFYERFLTVRPAGDDAAAARRLISQLKE